MDIYEAINTRRSVRSFTDAPVSRDVLKRIVLAGIARISCMSSPLHV